MAKQKLSPKAAAAKKARDLAFAKTFARKRKKAENQRKRRKAIKNGENIKNIIKFKSLIYINIVELKNKKTILNLLNYSKLNKYSIN